MISPSLIEPHLDIVRAFGARTRPLDDAVRRRIVRRRNTVAAGDIGVAITIRPAGRGDARAIARLALLDGRRLPEGRRVVAEADGRILAAAEVASGRTVADPFAASAAIAQLVALRARQLRPVNRAA